MYNYLAYGRIFNKSQGTKHVPASATLINSWKNFYFMLQNAFFTQMLLAKQNILWTGNISSFTDIFLKKTDLK